MSNCADGQTLRLRAGEGFCKQLSGIDTHHAAAIALMVHTDQLYLPRHPNACLLSGAALRKHDVPLEIVAMEQALQFRCPNPFEQRTAVFLKQA